MTYAPAVSNYDGRATDIDVHLTLLSLLSKKPLLDLHPIISDTGQLGPTTAESQKQSDLGQVNLVLPSSTNRQITVTADILDALTKSMGNDVTSWTNIVGANVGVAGTLSVTAGVLQSTAEVRIDNPSCSTTGAFSGTPVYLGSSTIADLAITVAGIPVTIPVNPAPNTTIVIANLAKIIFNEQIQSNGHLTVNAVHIWVGGTLSPLTTIEVVLAHSDAAISEGCVGTTWTNCPVTPPPPPPCTPHDFMTGGGYITLTGGGHGNFGFNGGYKGPGALQGHLNYVDHSKGGPHLQGDLQNDPSAYVGTGTSRNLTYNCGTSSCGLSGSDNGEPGKDVDGFALTGPNGYSVTGPYITFGNIQLHKATCPSSTP